MDETRRFAEMVRTDRQRADTIVRVGLCVSCAQRADDDMMTTCDECARTLCGYCAHSLSGEDVVCPDCYNAALLRDAAPGALPGARGEGEGE